MGIYLDHNATTPVRPEVADAIAAALRALPGNPSSTHAPGRAARAAVEDARAEVARLVGAGAEEIVFTSGGTEANALALRGLIRGALAARGSDSLSPRSGNVSERVGERGPHVVTSRLEHPSVSGALAAEAADVTFVAVDADGRIDADALRAALRPDTVLVTLALANHELGNVYDVAALARVAHEAGALFHTDAVQAAGKLAVDVGALGVDALTLSAHKIHGPKGVGAVYLRRGAPFSPLAGGGHQERERRAGTENVSGIVGFGVAARLAAAERAEAAARVAGLRDRLEARLLALADARRHGDSGHRLPGTLNIGFAGAPGQLVAAALDLDGISVSTGAACTSGSLAPSEVLLALGLSRADAACAIRFGIGATNTDAEIDRVADAVGEIVRTRGIRNAGGKRSASERVVVGDVGRRRLIGGGGAAGRARLRGHRRDAAPLRRQRHRRQHRRPLLRPARHRGRARDGRAARHRAPRDRRERGVSRLGDRRLRRRLPRRADAEPVRALQREAEVRAAARVRRRGGRGGAGDRPLRAARARTRRRRGAEPGARSRQGPVVLPVRRPSRAAVAGLVSARRDEQGRGARARAPGRACPTRTSRTRSRFCFIPDGDHVGFIAAHGGAGAGGDIVDDTTGARIGGHAGTHAFTIGQRRGLPGGAGAPRFVLRIDAATGEVRVGPRDRLGRDQLRVGDVRWLEPRPAAGALRCAVQIRHHAQAAPAWIELGRDGDALVRLDEPAFGVAPGQAAVFYDGDERVIGGGWIQ